MLPSSFPQNRGERLIAAGRVVLVAFSLLAVWLDPTEPAKYAELAYALMTIYVLYSALLAVLIWRMPVPHPVLALTTHALDLVLFTLFLTFTEGLSSPFFLYFIFSVLCATLRWQWQGALWTGLAALGTYATLGIYAARVLHEPGFELNRFIIRSVYLVVVTVLLGYLGSYEVRTRGDIARLAAWRHALPADAAELARTLLADMAGLLRAPRLVLAWDEPEEPWLNLAVWSRGEFERTRSPRPSSPRSWPSPWPRRASSAPTRRAPRRPRCASLPAASCAGRGNPSTPSCARASPSVACSRWRSAARW